MSFDYGQLAIDSEIAQMIKTVRGGFEFSRKDVLLDDIKANGPAGMFADNPSTLKRMSTTSFMPELADRKLREQWEGEGGSSIQQRAVLLLALFGQLLPAAVLLGQVVVDSGAMDM